MDYSIERHEPDPNQIKGQTTNSKTHHRFRWKENYILQNYAETEALEAFEKFGKNFRLFNKTENKLIRQNKTDYPF